MKFLVVLFSVLAVVYAKYGDSVSPFKTCTQAAADRCQGEDYGPICASNGITYPTLCELCEAPRQKSGKPIQVRFEGRCDDPQGDQPQPDHYREEKKGCQQYHVPGAPVGPDGKPKIPFCNRMYKPVCGSDGHTYGNHCMFCVKTEESAEHKTMTVAEYGACEGERNSIPIN